MLGVIGGSGLYALDGLNIEKEHDIETPFGKPSSVIVQGQYQGQSILFLSRHGPGHKYLPHEACVKHCNPALWLGRRTISTIRGDFGIIPSLARVLPDISLWRIRPVRP